MDRSRPEKRETNRAREQRVAREQQVQRPNDAIGFQTRNNIYTQNANLFISNNANPFLISPYGPPANLISKQVLEQLSTVISTLLGDLGQVLDLTTYTLRISTITPVSTSFDPSQSVTISSNIFNVNGQFPTSQMNVTMSSNFNVISTNFLTVTNTLSTNILSTNTLTTNTLIANSFNVTTLNAQSLVASTMNVSSILTASTINVSTLNARIGNLSTLTVSSLLTTSSINARIGNISTLSVNSTLNVNSTLVSTIEFPNYIILGTENPGVVGIPANFDGTLDITVGANNYRVPYFT